MNRSIRKTLGEMSLLLILTAGFYHPIHAQEYERWRYWENQAGFISYWVFANVSEGEASDAKKRWDEIGDSLETSRNPFAGTYFQSGNRGYYLRWSPEKGFIFVLYYEYFVKDFSYGRVVIEDSIVKFIPERELKGVNPLSRRAITPSSWVPAYQGKYFIRQESVKSFADFYGGFGEFNGFPRKWGCDCSPFAERVDKNVNYETNSSYILPPQFSRLVRQPISGKIVAIGKPYISKRPVSENGGELASATWVRLNLGRADGARKGLLFFLEPDYEGLHQIVKITRVGNKTSSAILIREIDENRNENYPDWNDESPKQRRISYPPVRIGSKVSTRWASTL